MKQVSVMIFKSNFYEKKLFFFLWSTRLCLPCMNSNRGSYCQGRFQPSQRFVCTFCDTNFASFNMHTVAAYLLTRIMAQIICTVICGGEAKKSSKWFQNSAPKVEQYYLQSLTCLARVHIKYTSPYTTLLLISTRNSTEFFLDKNVL